MPTTDSTGSAALARLTPREREVLDALASGKSNGAIADHLALSRRAVEKHINAIFSKLLVNDDEYGHPRVRAALLFLRAAAPAPARPAPRGHRELRHCGFAAHRHMRHA